jgi:hypothetical protein
MAAVDRSELQARLDAWQHHLNTRQTSSQYDELSNMHKVEFEKELLNGVACDDLVLLMSSVQMMRLHPKIKEGLVLSISRNVRAQQNNAYMQNYEAIRNYLSSDKWDRVLGGSMSKDMISEEVLGTIAALNGKT